MSFLFKTEKLIKDPLFACQHCGQCILSHTALIDESLLQIRDRATAARSRAGLLQQAI
jgi:hypothetical protein